MRYCFFILSCFMFLSITIHAQDRHPLFVTVEGEYCLWFGESKRQVWEDMADLDLLTALVMRPGCGSLYYRDIEINYREWDECKLEFDAHNKLYLVKMDIVFDKRAKRDSLYKSIMKDLKNSYGAAANTDKVRVEPYEKILACQSATFMNTVTLTKYTSLYYRNKSYHLQLLYSAPPEEIHKTRGIQTSFLGNEFGTPYLKVANRLRDDSNDKYQLRENAIYLNDVSFGGYKWSFFDFIFNSNSLLSKIEMQYPCIDKEEAEERFEILNKALTAKYGYPDFQDKRDDENILAFRDERYECWLELSYKKSTGGEKYHYCILTYIDTELNQQISEEL